MTNFDEVIAAIQALPVGTAIPKPQSRDSSRIARWGTRRGESALVYSMPNHSNPESSRQKGVNIGEFRNAYDVLATTGEFSRSWFRQNMPACCKEGGCNFTTIGGLFVVVGVAELCGPGVYKRK